MGCFASKTTEQPEVHLTPTTAMDLLRRQVLVTRRDLVESEELHRAAKKAYVRYLNTEKRTDAHDRLSTSINRAMNEDVRLSFKNYADEQAQKDRQEADRAQSAPAP